MRLRKDIKENVKKVKTEKMTARDGVKKVYDT